MASLTDPSPLPDGEVLAGPVGHTMDAVKALITETAAEVQARQSGDATIYTTLTPTKRTTDLPHIYSESNTPGVYTEITYGTAPAARAMSWTQDPSTGWVDGTAIVRIDTDADVGIDGKAFAIKLPKTAVLLGNYAQRVGSITFGVAVFDHWLCSLHSGRLNDLTNLDYCFVVPPNTGPLVHTTWNFGNGALVSSGAANTGWHDFHITFGYFGVLP